MPDPKHHLVQPVQTDDGQSLDETEILEDAEEKLETDPNAAEDELESIDSDIDEIDP